jgi:transposase
MKRLTVTGYTYDELRALAREKPEIQEVIRFLAVCVVASGCVSRGSADQVLFLSHSRVCYWVKRFNELGLEGLKDKPKPGKPSKLSEAQCAELKRLVLEQSPEIQGFNTATWTGPLLIEWIKREWGIEIKKATIYVLLKKRLGLSYQKGKGIYPEASPENREERVEAIKKTPTFTPQKRGGI